MGYLGNCPIIRIFLKENSIVSIFIVKLAMHILYWEPIFTIMYSTASILTNACVKFYFNVIYWIYWGVELPVSLEDFTSFLKMFQLVDIIKC